MQRSVTALAVVVAVAVTATVGILLSMSRNDDPVATSGSSGAGSSATAPRAPVYAALGSSFAAGPGSGEVVDRRCMRTADNYPHRVAEALGLALTDLTCSGSKAAELVAGSAPSAVRHRPAQVPRVPSDAALVTITSGGNDLNYVGRMIASACQNLRVAGVRNCGSGRVPAPPPSEAAYSRLEKTLVGVVEAVRKRAPRATVALVDYAPVAAIDAPPCERLPLLPWEVAETVTVADRMSRINARVANRTGAVHVSTAGAAAEHGVCGPAPWVRGVDGKFMLHPDAAGKAGIADLVTAALRPQI